MRFGTLLKTESDQSGQRNLVLNRHWREFEEQFETEADCLEALFARLEERARCANCSGQSFDRAYGSRQMECLHCGRKVRLTAGTFFHRKKCLRAWLAAIWLMERGVPLNASWLSKLTEIAYATAHEIFKRLTTVIENNRSPDAHCVGSELFVEIFSKRSRETPAREHPRAEQDEMERLVSKTTDARLEEPELSSTLLGELAIGERDLYKILSYTPVSFSDLCDQLGSTVQEMSVRITMLELRGLAVKLAGDRFVRSKFDRALLAPERKSSTQAYKNATRIMIFVRTYSHGISRKYLQNYAAAFWCHVDRSRWNVGSLLDACLDSEPISNSQIRNSVTPLLVKVTP